MTTYTLTQSQYELLHKTRNISEVYALATSLKPNSQEPKAWLVTFESGDEELHFEQSSIGETQEALYTHPAPISKEDIVKVLEVLELYAEFDPAYPPNTKPLNLAAYVLPIMQSAIEAAK